MACYFITENAVIVLNIEYTVIKLLVLKDCNDMAYT